jgi:hypothetical protein
MGKSLIQTTNQSQQTVAVNSIISLGSVLRRYGCNLRLSGNGIEVTGEGYYKIDSNVSVSPTAAGPVTVALYNNGVQIPGAIAYGSVSTAGNPITLPLETTIRQACCCDSADNITCVLLEGAGVVDNISVRVEKS